MSNPKISIVIPVYNGVNYLKEAIDSALSQDYENYEVIVVNDGSNDNGDTEKIALSYGSNIRYFKKENGGVATALNLAIEKAEGEYVSWLSHDDAYFPNKLSSQVSALLTLPESEKTILSSNIEIMDERSSKIDAHSYAYRDEEIAYELLMRWVISWCTLLIPRQAFAEVGGFDPSLKTTQDYHLWFRFIKAGYRFHHLSEVLVKSRAHPEQDSQKKIDVATRERRELEKFAFSIFSGEDFAKWSLSRYNPTVLVLMMKAVLFAKRAIPLVSRWTKKIGIYDRIAPIYTKYVLKK